MGSFSLEELRGIAKRIFSKAVDAVEPSKRLEAMLEVERGILVIKSDLAHEKRIDLKQFETIMVIGAGKASASMALAIERIFGYSPLRGVITTKYAHSLPLRHIEVVEAGHPVPDQNGVEGAKKIRDQLRREAGTKTLVIFLLSGGASALLPLPAEGVTLAEKQGVTQLLLDCGADIEEINIVRKHISQIKGGGLVRWAYPSTVLAFILSDVVGDRLDVIGSGPTVPDPSTFENAWSVLKKYGLCKGIAPSICKRIRLGMENKVQETPKPGDVAFGEVSHFLIGSNVLALKAADTEASSLGFHSMILSSSVVGETREAAGFHAAIAKEILSSGHPLSKPACLISGGETTVTLKGKGVGGRNQEFALAGALEIHELEQVVLLSGGTDGTDGPTDAAGAISDHTTVKRARLLGLDPRVHLEENNAYPFFQRLGDLLVTGPTHTNVMDVHLLFVC